MLSLVLFFLAASVRFGAFIRFGATKKKKTSTPLHTIEQLKLKQDNRKKKAKVFF